MMQKHITLVIMAAGLGSRYSKGANLKQLVKVGKNGQTLMDLSIYDALNAGFDKIVFVIRRDFEELFKETVGRRIEKICKIECVFQERSDVPVGYKIPEKRTVPWGTGHAILACRNVVKEPFAVINADDFYGKEAFMNISKYLSEEKHTDGIEDICLSGYILGNTLSENGGVTRGICECDSDGMLVSISETKNIHRENGKIVTGRGIVLPHDTLVSMNMWGLRPTIIEKLDIGFCDFLASLDDRNRNSEFLLPTFIDGLIKKGEAKAKLLPTNGKWFGITYIEDLPGVRETVNELIEKGEYPS